MHWTSFVKPTTSTIEHFNKSQVFTFSLLLDFSSFLFVFYSLVVECCWSAKTSLRYIRMYNIIFVFLYRWWPVCWYKYVTSDSEEKKKTKLAILNIQNMLKTRHLLNQNVAITMSHLDALPLFWNDVISTMDFKRSNDGDVNMT